MLLVYSLIVIVCSLIVTCIYVRWKQNEFLVKTKNIPLIDGLQHYPIIGLSHILFIKTMDEIYNTLAHLATETSANIFKGFIFTKLFIAVKNPEYIQKILLSPQFLEKASVYGYFPYLNSLFTSKGSMWKTNRKMLNTSFHITLINKRFIQQFNEAAQLLVMDLGNKIGISQFDLKPIMFTRSLDLQLKALFDIYFGNENLEIFTENIKMIQENFTDQILQKAKTFVLSFIECLTKSDGGSDERIINKNLEYIQPYFDIATRRYFEKMQLNSHLSEENIKIKPEIVIHRLVSMLEEGYVTNQTAQDHINFMLLAGIDTITVAVSNCILCLAMNVEAQENCAIEIKEVIGDQFNSISIEDLLKLELLDRTVNESLRLIPTAQVLGRICEQDFQLDDNTIIPAGTDVIIPIISIHRCKTYWGNNYTKFNPDNFLPENIAKRPQLSFLPFSYGPRNCIAKKYAQYAIKIYVAHLLVKYKFSTDLKFEELELGFNMITDLKNNYMIRIEKR